MDFNISNMTDKKQKYSSSIAKNGNIPFHGSSLSFFKYIANISVNP
ncbi:hypothetical protein CLPU_8c01330 [Gottschalkia purinilytica]|uniref:Uncharacterized protein n=1 Tax=Gottschalkia purinilytica TaxID=1503 RepID=A0A0L0W9Z5_GOTPU|nr:hypothetical protein CLPU_8c01330 [Gottschalkia purinilytica]